MLLVVLAPTERPVAGYDRHSIAPIALKFKHPEAAIRPRDAFPCVFAGLGQAVAIQAGEDDAQF